MTITGGLRAVFHSLFGSPDVPPLGRKAFLKQGLFVLLARGLPVHVVLSFLPLWLDGLYREDPYRQHGPGLLIVMLVILGAFVIPYFRIMHWRLKGMGFPFPRVFVLTAAYLLLLVTVKVSFGGPPVQFLAHGALFSGVYLLLLPWPEKHPAEPPESPAHRTGDPEKSA